MESQKIVTVFGGSQCGPESQEWQQAYEIGTLLARAGYTVCSGGYQGTMHAVSQSAHEAGGAVIGVTLSLLTAAINPFLTEERPTSDFYARLQGLIHNSIGYIAVRGGVGTLVEITLVWNHFMTNSLPRRPLVLVGHDVWQPWLDACRATLAVEQKHLDLLSVVETPAEAITIIRNSERISP